MTLKRTLPLACVALFVFSILPVIAPLVGPFIVSPGQNFPKAFESTNGNKSLDVATTVSGWVRASGGQANDIRFYVTDPNNVTVAFYGNITYTEFSFVASTTGTYTAHFDNSGSPYAKSINFNYSLAAPILGISQGLFYSITAAILIGAIVIVVVVLILRRRQRAKLKLEPTKTAAQKSL